MDFQTFLGNKNDGLKINDEEKSERTHFTYLFYNVGNIFLI